jgi:hypothetical protein
LAQKIANHILPTMLKNILLREVRAVNDNNKLVLIILLGLKDIRQGQGIKIK